MRSRSLHTPKINIITLGCSKNLVDSETLAGQLRAQNREVVHEEEGKDHDIVVLNTCGFIDRAREESVQAILEQVDRKKRGQLKKVFVTGCLSARYPQELGLEIPEVDGWFGTLELPGLLKALGADYRSELLGERLLSTPAHYAYLKISEGCNRTCAFCAIPLMRGRHISRPMEEILQEAEMLVRRGVREIILIAQELTYYGLDNYRERRLAALLEQLAGIRGLEWIRLHYAYPSKFPLEILDTMVRHPNICRYLDLPLQHISDPILKAMNRQITRGEIFRLIEQIRLKVPDICLRTTLICGFPGETPGQVEELKDFLREIRFDRLGVFTYSQEEGTSAYGLGDLIPAEEKECRAEQIMEIQQKISWEKNQAKLGQTLRVLVDKLEAGRFIGRTEQDSVEVDQEVILSTAEDLHSGEFVQARVTGAFDYDLEAEVLSRE